MKKIVGILAASAVLATSVFAADVAAKVKLTGSVLTYDMEASSAKGFDVNRDGKADPMFTLSIDDTTVGATVKMDINAVKKGDTVVADGSYVKAGDTTIWFKPMDGLKVTVGNGAAPGLDSSLEEGEGITGDARLKWKTQNGASVSVGDSEGYGIEYSMDALTIAGYIGNGYGNTFFGPTNETVANARVKVAYAADGVGTIAVLAASQQSFAKNWFGAEYKNTFDALTVLAEAGVTIANNDLATKQESKMELTSVDFLASAKYTMDALTVAGDVFGSVITADKASDKVDSTFFLSVFAKVSYAMGNVTPYLLVKAENLTKVQPKNATEDLMAITIKPGVDGTFGLLSWATGVEITIQDKKNKIDVPVEFSVAF